MLEPKDVRIETRWDDDPHVTRLVYRDVSFWSEAILWTRLHRSGQIERQIHFPFPQGRQVITDIS